MSEYAVLSPCVQKYEQGIIFRYDNSQAISQFAGKALRDPANRHTLYLRLLTCKQAYAVFQAVNAKGTRLASPMNFIIDWSDNLTATSDAKLLFK